MEVGVTGSDSRRIHAPPTAVTMNGEAPSILVGRLLGGIGDMMGSMSLSKLATGAGTAAGTTLWTATDWMSAVLSAVVSAAAVAAESTCADLSVGVECLA